MSARLVVDASVVIQRFIVDIYTPHAKRLFAGLAQSDQLYIPEFCLLECTNVLWKQVRFNGMPQAQAARLVNDLIALPLRVVPVSGLLPRALQISLTYQLAVYDSLYIALAEELNCPLITVDQRQSRAAASSNIALKPITDFAPWTT